MHAQKCKYLDLRWGFKEEDHGGGGLRIMVDNLKGKGEWKQKDRQNSKTKCNREIMKERANKMEADKERNNKNENMTGGQKNKNKKDDFPHQYPLLSHCCVHLGSWQGVGRGRGELLSRQTNKLAIFNTSWSLLLYHLWACRRQKSLPFYLSISDVCGSLVLTWKVSISLYCSLCLSFPGFLSKCSHVQVDLYVSTAEDRNES